MRYGVLSDVHGNLPALQATLDVLRRRGVDAYIHLGDLVGYGPFPNECIEIVAELEPVGVVGNHELIVLGRLSADSYLPLARETLAWTATVLTDSSRSYIESLALRATPAEAIVATHASLADPEEYVTTIEQAAAELEHLAHVAPTASLLLVGHTHRPRAYGLVSGEARFGGQALPLDHETWLLNPGSVGQSRERRIRASCILLDLDQGDAVLLSLPYDVDRTRRELQRHGLYPRAYHWPPSRFGSLSAAARAVGQRRRHRRPDA